MPNFTLLIWTELAVNRTVNMVNDPCLAESIKGYSFYCCNTFLKGKGSRPSRVFICNNVSDISIGIGNWQGKHQQAAVQACDELQASTCNVFRLPHIIY